VKSETKIGVQACGNENAA